VLIYINVFCCVFQVLFLHFNLLFSLKKEIFKTVWAILLLVLGNLSALKGRSSGFLRYFISFKKVVWSDFSSKREAKREVKGAFPGDSRGVP